MGSGDYGGDVDVGEVWERLADQPAALLVDVRTRAEWNFVGIPDLRSIGKAPVLLEWQSYPSMELNARFLADLEAEVARRGLGHDTPVYFLCRSGVRSRSAAIAAAAGGFSEAYNVAGGFEGPVGPDGRRGRVSGWKASGLPWTQS